MTVLEDAYLVETCLVKKGLTTQEASVEVFSCDKSLPNQVLAIGDMDYSESSVNVAVTFQPHETRRCFNVAILDDKIVESPEVFGVCVRSEVDVVDIGTNDSVSFTIEDNDGKLRVS